MKNAEKLYTFDPKGVGRCGALSVEGIKKESKCTKEGFF